MKDVIIALQKYQEYAIDNGMSFTLDIVNSNEETKAFVTVRYTSTNSFVDDQRYMNVSISSDEDNESVDSKLIYINNFMYQISTSLNNKQEKE